MHTKGLKAREAILRAASELLEETGEGTNLQIREVAKLAGVSVGAPNYYFGSKENLINEAISARSARVLDRWLAQQGNLNVGLEEKLRIVSKNVGRYYATHPKICRVRLNSDLFLGHEDPMRKRYHDEVLLPLSREMAPHRTEEERKLVINVISDAFDLTFLRAMSGSYDVGFDYRDDEARDRFADRLVDLALELLKP
jgi:AcrR family transcriptional regulator